jgi:hypothetical protein
MHKNELLTHEKMLYFTHNKKNTSENALEAPFLNHHFGKSSRAGC